MPNRPDAIRERCADEFILDFKRSEGVVGTMQSVRIDAGESTLTGRRDPRKNQLSWTGRKSLDTALHVPN